MWGENCSKIQYKIWKPYKNLGNRRTFFYGTLFSQRALVNFSATIKFIFIIKVFKGITTLTYLQLNSFS